MVTMVWEVSRFRLKAPPGISSSCVSPLTSSGQRSRASWASQPQKSATLSPQPGEKPRKFIRICGGIGGEKKRCGEHLLKHTVAYFWLLYIQNYCLNIGWLADIDDNTLTKRGIGRAMGDLLLTRFGKQRLYTESVEVRASVIL